MIIFTFIRQGPNIDSFCRFAVICLTLTPLSKVLFLSCLERLLTKHAKTRRRVRNEKSDLLKGGERRCSVFPLEEAALGFLDLLDGWLTKRLLVSCVVRLSWPGDLRNTLYGFFTQHYEFFHSKSLFQHDMMTFEHNLFHESRSVKTGPSLIYLYLEMETRNSFMNMDFPLRKFQQ